MVTMPVACTSLDEALGSAIVAMKVRRRSWGGCNI
jgi:hypothetical protein